MVAGELDVRSVGRPGPLADPQEMRRRVVDPAGPRVCPGQGLLVGQDQRLVTGVELHRPQLFRLRAAGPHEGQCPVDLAGQPLVALAGRALGDEVLVPGVHLAQVRVAARGECAAQVQRDRRAVIGTQQPGRVGRAVGRGEIEAVDRVAAVGGQRHAVPHLGGA